MFNLSNFFAQGLNNTLLLRNNTTFSHNGPTTDLQPDTVLYKWFLREFSAGEFTISVDYDSRNKEIVKLLVTNTLDTASLVIYGRSFTRQELIDIEVRVNDSFVELVINPKANKIAGAKIQHTAHLFQSQTQLKP